MNTSADRVKKHREKMRAEGVSSCAVMAPIQYHKTLQALGKLLKHGDETAKGIISSAEAYLSSQNYTPYTPPNTETYKPPETPIEPAILDVLTRIAAALGNLKDPELVRRLERQVQITIDAHQAKQAARLR